MLRKQKKLLELIKEIDEICKNNGIVYYAAGGTVIGAVRHEGFIPWDDDIDIYMTRDNWNKFRACLEDNIPNERVLECWENNSGYQNLLGRYMDTTSTEIFKYQLYGDANMGQLIDVFILDPVINSADAVRNYEKNVMLASDLVSDCITYSSRLESCEEYAQLRDQMRKKGRRVVVNEVVSRLEQYSEEEAELYMLRWGGVPHVFTKDMFQEPTYLQFEDMQMAMPTKICNYLNQLYGLDWMYIPNKEDQIVHSYLIEDNDMPYSRVKELICSRVDLSATDRFVNKKKKLFSNLEAVHEAKSRKLSVEGEFVVEKIKNTIEANGVNVFEEYEKQNYELLWEIFEEYIEMQSSKDFIGNGTVKGYYRKKNPEFIDIGDDYLYVILQILLERNLVSKACKILTSRELQDRPLDDKLCEIKNIVKVICKCADLFERKKYSEAESLVDECYRKTNNLQLVKFKLFLIEARMEELPDSVDICKLEKWINIGKKRAPQDGDFNKFAGDVFWIEGNKDAAVREYTFSLLHTRNGIIRMHICKKMANNMDYVERLIEDVGNNGNVIDAWREVFPGDVSLIVNKLAYSNDAFDEMWNERFLRTLVFEKESKQIIQAIANNMRWKPNNVKVECALRSSELENDEAYELDNEGIRNLVDFKSNEDIDLWQQAELLKLEGKRSEAYKIYWNICDCSDKYVKSRVIELFRDDFAGLIEHAENNLTKWVLAETRIKVGNMDAESYVRLMKQIGIIGKDYSIKKGDITVAEFFMQAHVELSEYLEQ